MKKIPQQFFSSFEKHLKENPFFKPGEKILIACSGGPDSVALTHLLHRISSRNRWKLALLHFNHQLRRAAKTDERFVRKLSKKMRIPFVRGTGDVGKKAKEKRFSVEEAAREMRYAFFIKTARSLKASKVALAHTLDDQAETVLMRILQGTGLRGLQGIREINKVDRVSFIRPLIGFTKKKILDFLKCEKIRYRKDKSNESLRFVRNRIRLKLLPTLCREFNPRVVESIARIPTIVREESTLLEELEKDAWKKVVKRSGRGKLELKHDIFMGLPHPLQFRVLEKALKKIDSQSGLSFDAWKRVRAGLSRPRNRWSLPKDIDLALTPKKVTLYKKNA